MPVLSPHRSSASGLTGSYRSTFSSSPIDRPYYTSSYNPRISNYSERFVTRTYTDVDGRRICTRSGSITEDGVTTRFREESREGSIRRDSITSNDTDYRHLPSSTRNRDTSITRNNDNNSRLSTINVLDSVAELHKKYSPANYVPACLRNKNNDNITRSKSINDIGLPPIESSTTTSKMVNNKKNKVIDNNSLNYNNSIGVLNSNNTNDNNGDTNDNNDINDDNDDDNGNRASVADLKKKFDVNKSLNNSSSSISSSNNKTIMTPPPIITTTTPLEIDAVKISENRFKKQDLVNNGLLSNNKKVTTKKVANNKVKSPLTTTTTATTKTKTVNGCSNNDKIVINNCNDVINGFNNKDIDLIDQNTDDNNDNVDNGVINSNNSLSRNSSRVNNFASYIPSKDYEQQQQRNTIIPNGISTTNNTTTTTINEDINLTNGVSIGNDLNETKRLNDYTTTSPKLSNKSSIGSSPSSTSSSSSSSSNSIINSRRSVDRERLIGSNNIINNISNNSSGVGTSNSNNYNHETSPTLTIKTLGLNGLKNIGNTCFMNSVIQCLSNTKPLMEYLKNDYYLNDINTSISSMKGALIKAFSEVIKELWSEDSLDRVINTSSLKSQIQRFAPRFIGYAQQDAQEFLRYLLEGLHEDVNRVIEKPKPILTEIDEKLSDNEKATESWSRYLRMDNSRIVDYFVGQLKSTLKCTHCGHCSVTFDPFWDLSLPIPQRTGQLRLSQCLDSFTREETLDGDEKPTCSKCKERRKCTKSFTIQKFPKILVIHLKRFSPTERFRGKLNVTVDFPLEGLDMSHYTADGVSACRYNLYAISNHSGTTYSGHYTAYCRHPYAKTWHEYNDSRVSSISSKSIVSGEAYVLFYEQEGQKSHL